MERIVIISSGLAGAKTAARIKRQAPSAEVNLVVPIEVEEGSKQGIFGKNNPLAHVSSVLLDAKQISVLPMTSMEMDFKNKTVHASSPQGSIPIRYTKLIMEIDAAPRLPRAVRGAQNVIPWPLEQAGLVDEWLESYKPQTAVVYGGAHALSLIDPLVQAGVSVTWARSECAEFDPEFWHVVSDKVEAGAEGKVRVVPMTEGPVTPELTPEGDIRALTCGSESVEGEVFFWADAPRAVHPIVAEQGVDLDPSGFISVKEDFSCGLEDVYLFGSAVAVKRAEVAGKSNAPYEASSVDSLVSHGRVLSSIVLEQPVTWNGSCASSRYQAADCVAFRTGLTQAEAVAAGYEPEFVIFDAAPVLADIKSDAVIKLVCDKATDVVLGAQVCGALEAAWIDAVASGTAVALAGNMTVQALSCVDMAAGGMVLRKAASMLSNKLEERIFGITPDELIASREAGAKFFILDLRDQIAWRAGHIQDAYNIPFTQLKKRLQDEVPRFTPLVIVSHDSDIPYSIACYLYGLGATSLYVLDGGMELWPYDLVAG
ncbi:rhodanese-like domain-containing protein [Halodesulfovibrio marinisediminis]|uniref:NADH dehydrogenase, FAD-containing subunit n=1 Tax=Halodesulfovibrio marinisediminis DSM 17456 TaxID=1121457 RepID=A0A1N6DU82_9BACT|nr:rhodanese-like domain-containing protein [Halodesulfovibrio marinisediminis]SIN74267.1 NADH dehydrogenase, FAD-containing subunit [Halodesulfovibrio marinisediminis DSM 17456]